MSVSTKIAVAGATGRVGRHVTDVLREAGHDAVPMSRATGVDVVTGKGLDEALSGVEIIIDTATGASPDQAHATEFFTSSARNLQRAGAEAGVRRIVVVSIVGVGEFTAGYNHAKLEHEHALQAGPIPVRILRATQFHEFVGQLVEWGTQGEVCYVPEMRTQLIAARSVAEGLVRVAVADGTEGGAASGPISEIAGPRVESMVDMARLLVRERGDAALQMTGASDPADPDRDLYLSGALLPGPDATLAGPTFAEWLKT